VADDIRALSTALARDPSSLRYVDLAEALRRRGQLQEAMQVALHGLGRHPGHADGYDCLARIHSDRAELSEARAAWERVLAILPEHLGALKGIGFLYFRQGDVRRASEALEHALAVDPADEATRRALAAVRGEPAPARRSGPARTRAALQPAPEPAPAASVVTAAPATPAAPAAPVAAAASAAPHAPAVSAASAPSARPPVFGGLEGATTDILLLDARGLVMAGGLSAGDGSDVSELAAAALAGVSGEAERTCEYMALGAWTAIVAEAEHANVVLAPASEGAVLMVRRERSTPVGLALRIADRARGAAVRWLQSVGV
jgi:tetratricopeptide (TPR) repeat protein